MLPYLKLHLLSESSDDYLRVWNGFSIQLNEGKLIVSSASNEGVALLSTIILIGKLFNWHYLILDVVKSAESFDFHAERRDGRNRRRARELNNINFFFPCELSNLEEVDDILLVVFFELFLFLA